MCLLDVLLGRRWKQDVLGGGCDGRWFREALLQHISHSSYHPLHFSISTSTELKEPLGWTDRNSYLILNCSLHMCLQARFSANASTAPFSYQSDRSIAGTCMGPGMPRVCQHTWPWDCLWNTISWCNSGSTSLSCPGFHGLHHVH